MTDALDIEQIERQLEARKMAASLPQSPSPSFSPESFLGQQHARQEREREERRRRFEELKAQAVIERQERQREHARQRESASAQLRTLKPEIDKRNREVGEAHRVLTRWRPFDEQIAALNEIVRRKEPQ